MASLIPGYEYDVFISYRQKDNKYDGWVNEFVDKLDRELDSMFKEDVNVYFDINPSDYLLENYDVDASLKDKLKCLVFIPVISRTYCDPKSFAWEYEFKPFVELTSDDRFGMKVKLPNGNTTNRVLPVRIHDLDSSDVELFESTIGGVLRPIDFIYKETGVNRQLRAKDDDIIKSPDQILYRDQINKIALAVREIIQSMRLQETGDRKPLRELETTKEKIIKDEVSAEPKISNVGDPVKKVVPVRSILKGRSLLWLLILLIVITGAGLLLNYRSNIRWAKNEGLNEIERLFSERDYTEAFDLAKKAEKYISKDTVLQELFDKVSTRLTILTDPPGANISWKAYSDISESWIYLGQAPVDSLQVPVETVYRFRIDLAGYDTVYGAVSTNMGTISRKLFESGEIPEGMVYIDGYWDEVKFTWEENLGFYIDKYEVTNRQFKVFVDHGGYSLHELWKHEFIKEGKKLSWEEAMTGFVDKTGRQGPSTWEAGDYPEGQEDYPVSGVSWYEANAYAEFAGKVLPTADHWDSGVGYHLFTGYESPGKFIIPLSNFNGRAVRVGEKEGISFYGEYDVAGNVREWCWNKAPLGRIIAGAGYEGPTYMFLQWDQFPPFDRSHQNGFRCALYIDRDKIPETAFRFIDLDLKNERDPALETPVPESTYKIYKNQFLYDEKDLNAVVEIKDESYDDWVMEKINFDAAYDNQRMIAYVFLPKNSSPPYQTLIFFPGSYAQTSYEDLLSGTQGNPGVSFDYILKSGRAVVYPIYIGTWERNEGQGEGATNSHEYTEFLIKLVKDFSRTIDYLESRDDIDTSKIGYYGHSWGGVMGAIIPAVEDRLSLSILIAAGFHLIKPYPEVDEINYITRVKVPTLILNGRYDAIFPLETNVIPFYNLLGTPEEDKSLYLIDAGHNFYRRERIVPTLEWIDKYFGPPDYLQNK
ncbi:MAG: SUMF1/EgtB/PvdO family nonheme iron enzyme [Bacteroidales bacterium]|nr:SUMF1/EgtB/PvdO family nonheme iron enzyme [Bacteroidales bacterium]